jgi:hypothetical protein
MSRKGRDKGDRKIMPKSKTVEQKRRSVLGLGSWACRPRVRVKPKTKNQRPKTKDQSRNNSAWKTAKSPGKRDHALGRIEKNVKMDGKSRKEQFAEGRERRENGERRSPEWRVGLHRSGDWSSRGAALTPTGKIHAKKCPNSQENCTSPSPPSEKTPKTPRKRLALFWKNSKSPRKTHTLAGLSGCQSIETSNGSRKRERTKSRKSISGNAIST